MPKVVFFTGNILTYRSAEEAAEQMGGDVAVIYCENNDIREQVKAVQNCGVRVIMGKGWTQAALQEILGADAIWTGYFDETDTIRAIASAKAHTPKKHPHIGLMPHKFQDDDLSFFENIFDVKLSLYLTNSFDKQSMLDNLKKAMADGVDIVCGNTVIAKYAYQLGIPCVTETRPLNKGTMLNNFRAAVSLAEYIERLDQASADLQHVVNFSSDAIIYLDEEETIRLWNRRAESLFQLNSADVMGRNIHDIIPELDHKLLSRIKCRSEPTLGHTMKYQSQVLVLNFVPIVGEHSQKYLAIYVSQLRSIEDIRVNVAGNLSHNGYCAQHTFDDIWGQSDLIKQTKETAKQYSLLDATVMLTGETGVGKELFAQSIHNSSFRSKMPFVAINCASFPENLLESELFGYAPGAFTGASRSGKDGLFILANKGTLFLDEISGLSLNGQRRLLRAIEERSIMRIGDSRLLSIDVRIIAASNRNLLHMVEEGLFLADLYYRLNILTLKIPALNAHPDDIPLLAEKFLEQYSQELHKPLKFTPDALSLLRKALWKGNIRQLRYFCQRIAVVSDMFDVNSKLVEKQLNMDEIPVNGELGTISERERICALLEKYHGNKAKVAHELGISKTTLWRRECLYGLNDKGSDK